MDAYAFAMRATQGAQDALRALVDQGTLRVTVPIIGADAAYAAASADTPSELQARIDSVQQVAGLESTVVLLATQAHNGMPVPGLTATPTWLAPQEVLGFARVVTLPGAPSAVYQLAATVAGVIGLATVTAAATTVLAEVTGATVDAVNAAFNQLGSLPGVVGMATSIGDPALGRGVPQATPWGE